MNPHNEIPSHFDPAGAAPDAATRSVALAPRPPREYFHDLREDRPRWWKPVLIAVVMVVAYLVASFGLGIAAIGIETMRGNLRTDQVMNGEITMTPLVFGSALLSLAILWPVSLLLHKLFYPGRPVGALYSVVGRFRWRWAARAVLVAVAIQGVYYALAAVFFREHLGMSDVVADPLPWLIVVVLLMPVQAAAEEISFRGLLGRSIGGLFARAGVALAVALTISTLAFGLAHFASDPWLIAYYTGFGLVMGVVAWRTGGIEASIVLHGVNNLLSGGLGAFFSDLSHGIDRSAGAGSPVILVHLAVIAAIGAILVWMAGRSGLAVTTQPDPGARVPGR